MDSVWFDPMMQITCDPPPMVPRDFHYNRPFFVFLWREGAEWPYVGAWVGDDAGMESWQ